MDGGGAIIGRDGNNFRSVVAGLSDKMVVGNIGVCRHFCSQSQPTLSTGRLLESGHLSFSSGMPSLSLSGNPPPSSSNGTIKSSLLIFPSWLIALCPIYFLFTIKSTNVSVGAYTLTGSGSPYFPS